MTTSASPSDCLARLQKGVAAFLLTVPADVASAALGRAEEHIMYEPPVDAWMLTAAEVTAEHEVARGIAALAGAVREEDLAAVIAAIQRLDEWHAPLTERGTRLGHRGGLDHEAAAVRLELDGRMNAFAAEGAVIPNRVEGWDNPGGTPIHDRVLGDYLAASRRITDAPTFRLADLLEWTAYLPPFILASNQDGGVGPTREVALSYRRVAVAEDRAPPRTGALKVMIAPVLEQESEVTLRPISTPCTYEVRPDDMCARVDALVERALEGDVDLLLMPEMSLSGITLEHLAKRLSERRLDVTALGGRPPRLAWIMVGVLDERLKQGANFVAILAGDGREVARQEKISRWNMDREQQAQFDLLIQGELAPERREEPIRGAPDVVVADIPGLGRVTVLICADMDIELPGNWMFANANLDWLYAPIMDKTTPLRRDRPIGSQSWIVGRAFRAAAAARAKVAMTNSMPLTEMVNRTNADRGNSWPPFETCTIALLVDGAAGDVSYAAVEVPLSSTSPVAVSLDWLDGWSSYDLPPPTPTPA